jgi:nitroreductase / dihydropteridine reductase
MTDIACIVKSRYSTKAYDPERRIDAERVRQLQTLLRFAPSSTNSQPWHFVIAATTDARENIARACTGPYGANEAKVLNASHVVVLCARNDLDEEHLQRVLQQEQEDGRFKRESDRETVQRVRGFYVDMHRNGLNDMQHWMEKQVYLALGFLLLGAASLEIDATPIEGFDRGILDETLGLGDQGLRSVVLAALGYRSADDFNAALPKSRLPEDELFTLL